AKFETDSDAPSLSYYEPHVVVYIEEYTINGQRQNVLSDVGGLYAWYRSLVEDVNTAVSPEIRQLSDSLTGGLSTDREKVQAVFDWVQDNIKYVAFEDGMSGFIPREASKVCSKRYGDCKDMTSITTELLKAANIPAYLTWIGSRDIPYSYSELPTPMVDNHMIAAVKLDGEFVFLDATSQYTPIGFPTAFIQGKEALVGVGSENFELVQVPEVAMERNSYRDSIVLEVNGAEVIGTAEARFSGYQKVDMVRPFNARPVNKQKDFIQARLIKGHNKFRLDDFSVTGADNKATDFQVDYRFTVPDYAKNIGSAVYINLNLDKTLYNEQIDPQVRKLPIEVKYKTVEEFITDLRIPEGYRVDYLPKDQEFRNEAFGFSMQYRQEDGRVILTKRIYSNTLVVQPEQFEAWNQMIESIDQAYNEVVVLKQ
ncbi:MAG: transglutaminase domain-containing protein, partial [Bacteroidota bacterium]